MTELNRKQRSASSTFNLLICCKRTLRDSSRLQLSNIFFTCTDHIQKTKHSQSAFILNISLIVHGFRLQMNSEFHTSQLHLTFNNPQHSLIVLLFTAVTSFTHSAH